MAVWENRPKVRHVGEQSGEQPERQRERHAKQREADRCKDTHHCHREQFPDEPPPQHTDNLMQDAVHACTRANGHKPPDAAVIETRLRGDVETDK